MSIYLNKAWEEFQRTMAGLSDKSQPKDVFLLIQSWLEEHEGLLHLNGIKEYSLHEYINIDINKYPIQYSNLRDEELKSFKKKISLPHRDVSGIGRVINGALERLVVFEVGEYCLNCGKYGLGAYEDPNFEKIVLECNQCGYAIYEDEHPYDNKNKIVPATEASLRKFRYII